MQSSLFKRFFLRVGSTVNNATPKILNSFYSKENSDSKISTDVEDDDKILSKRKFSDLVQRLIETQAQLLREKNNSNILRSQLRAKCKVINRFKNKPSSGNRWCMFDEGNFPAIIWIFIYACFCTIIWIQRSQSFFRFFEALNDLFVNLNSRSANLWSDPNLWSVQYQILIIFDKI